MELFNKKEVIDYVIQRIEEDIKTSQTSYERTHRESMDAPSAMQSHHDTSGKESAWLAIGIAQRLEELVNGINILKHLELPKTNGSVVLSSIVSLVDLSNGDDINYIILPVGGGKTFAYNGNSITIISPLSPISQCLFGKRPGQKVDINLPAGKSTYLLSNIY